MYRLKNKKWLMFLFIFLVIPYKIFSQNVVGEATITIEGYEEFKINQIQFTNVSQDKVFNKGEEFVVQTAISGKGTGSFSYGWYLDGIIKYSGSEQMASGQTVYLPSQKDFIKTDAEGVQHTYYLKISYPNEVQSEVINYKVQKSDTNTYQIVLTSPENGDLSNPFKWEEVAGAVTYKIIIGKDLNLSNANTYTTFKNLFQYPANTSYFKHNDIVYWQVKASGPNQELLAESKVENFIYQNEIDVIEDELSQISDEEGACEEEKIVNVLKIENKERKEKYNNAFLGYEKLKDKCNKGIIHPVTGTSVCDITNKYVYVYEFAKKIKEADKDLETFANEKIQCTDLESCIKLGGGK